MCLADFLDGILQSYKNAMQAILGSGAHIGQEKIQGWVLCEIEAHTRAHYPLPRADTRSPQCGAHCDMSSCVGC